MVMGIKIDWDWVTTILISCIVIGGALYLLIWAILIFRAEANCLILGFPNSVVTWNLKSYCASLYDAKSVVVPLLR